MSSREEPSGEAQQIAELTAQTKANRLDARLLKISGKFRRRQVDITNASGYHTIMEVWVDLFPCVEIANSFEAWWAMQYMLRITGEFQEYCVAFREDEDIAHMPNMFLELEKAWLQLLEREDQGEISTTDKIRSLNLFRDGNDKAESLHIGKVYEQVMQLLTR